MESLFKGNRAVILSIVAHTLLLLWLLFSSGNQGVEKQIHQQLNANKVTKKAIESYLYKKPAPIKTLAENKKLNEVEKITADKTHEAKKTKLPNNTSDINEQQVLENDGDEVKNVIIAEKANSSVSATVVKSVSKVPENFSSFSQLDHLREAINKKLMAEEIANFQQFRSASEMHADQIPVPHSNIQLTPEQKREQNTTRMSDSLSITKYDNGLCTLERKQFLSSPIEGSHSAFTCGESRFEQNFREHMKKIQKRYTLVDK